MDAVSFNEAARANRRLNKLHTYSDVAPVNPSIGDTWFNTANGVTYERVDDDGTPVWVGTITNNLQEETILDGGNASTNSSGLSLSFDGGEA